MMLGLPDTLVEQCMLPLAVRDLRSAMGACRALRSAAQAVLLRADWASGAGSRGIAQLSYLKTIALSHDVDSVVVLPQGQVCCSYAKGIYLYDMDTGAGFSTGDFFDDFTNVEGLACDSTSYLYVTVSWFYDPGDPYRTVLRKYDFELNDVVSQPLWGEEHENIPARLSGSSTRPGLKHLTICSGRLYIVSFWDNCVGVFRATDFTFLFSFGGSDDADAPQASGMRDAPGCLDAPQGITNDGYHVYVADCENERIQCFTANGELKHVLRFFNYPVVLAVSPPPCARLYATHGCGQIMVLSIDNLADWAEQSRHQKTFGTGFPCPSVAHELQCVSPAHDNLPEDCPEEEKAAHFARWATIYHIIRICVCICFNKLTFMSTNIIEW